MIKRFSIPAKVVCLPLSVVWCGDSCLGCTRAAPQFWSAICCRSSCSYDTGSWRESGSSSFLLACGCTSTALMVKAQTHTNSMKLTMKEVICLPSASDFHFCFSPFVTALVSLFLNVYDHMSPSPFQLRWWKQSRTLTRGRHRPSNSPRTSLRRSGTDWLSWSFSHRSDQFNLC